MPVSFTLDGRDVACPDGLTVAGALVHLRSPVMRLTERAGRPRSIFCGMGVCFDCVMEIDGRQGVRSCTTLVRPGMRVVTQRGATRTGSFS